MLMDGVRMPLTVNMFYFCDPDGHSPYVQNQEALPVDEATPSIGLIEFKDLTCKNTENCYVCAYGLPERYVEGIKIKNVNVSFLPPDKRRPVLPVMMDNFPEMAGKSMFLKNMLFPAISGKSSIITGSTGRLFSGETNETFTFFIFIPST